MPSISTPHSARRAPPRAPAWTAGGFAPPAPPKPILISAQPRLTFARAAKLLRDPDRNCEIHSTALVPASAKIGKNVGIGPRAILGEHVKIGDETTIGAGSVIGDDAANAVKIGSP